MRGLGYQGIDPLLVMQQSFYATLSQLSRTNKFIGSLHVKSAELQCLCKLLRLFLLRNLFGGENFLTQLCPLSTAVLYATPSCMNLQRLLICSLTGQLQIPCSGQGAMPNPLALLTAAPCTAIWNYLSYANLRDLADAPAVAFKEPTKRDGAYSDRTHNQSLFRSTPEGIAFRI
jgi:hypothetical protein